MRTHGADPGQVEPLGGVHEHRQDRDRQRQRQRPADARGPLAPPCGGDDGGPDDQRTSDVEGDQEVAERAVPGPLAWYGGHRPGRFRPGQPQPLPEPPRQLGGSVLDSDHVARPLAATRRAMPGP